MLRVGNVCYFTSEEDEEVFEVTIEGFAVAETMLSAFSVVIKQNGTARRWVVDPYELELAPDQPDLLG